MTLGNGRHPERELCEARASVPAAKSWKSHSSRSNPTAKSGCHAQQSGQAQRVVADGAGAVDRAAGRRRSRRRRAMRDSAAGRPRVFRRARPARDHRSDRRRARVALRPVYADHAHDSRAVAAGDRPGAGHRHGGRLPVGRHVRLDRGGRRSQLRHAGHQDRAVLLHAGRGRFARHQPQEGDGNAAHGRARAGPRSRADRPGQSRGAARTVGRRRRWRWRRRSPPPARTPSGWARKPSTIRWRSTSSRPTR